MATLKQKLVIPKIIEHRGNVSRAMKDVGYSEASAKNPSNLTRSKGWQELMEKYLPDKHLSARHREFLDAPRQIRTYKKGDLVSETEETDPSAVKALDMAYKLKGRYNSDSEGNKTLIINISSESASRYNVTPSIKTPVIHEQVEPQNMAQPSHEGVHPDPSLKSESQSD